MTRRQRRRGPLGLKLFHLTMFRRRHHRFTHWSILLDNRPAWGMIGEMARVEHFTCNEPGTEWRIGHRVHGARPMVCTGFVYRVEALWALYMYSMRN